MQLSAGCIDVGTTLEAQGYRLACSLSYILELLLLFHAWSIVQRLAIGSVSRIVWNQVDVAVQIPDKLRQSSHLVIVYRLRRKLLDLKDRVYKTCESVKVF